MELPLLPAHLGACRVTALSAQSIVDIWCAIIHHQIIVRTTIDIDDPILKELKKLMKKEGKSLGRIVSDLLAQALQRRTTSGRQPKKPRWISRDLDARINLDDKEALYAAIDQRSPADKRTVRGRGVLGHISGVDLRGSDPRKPCS